MARSELVLQGMETDRSVLYSASQRGVSLTDSSVCTKTDLVES